MPLWNAVVQITSEVHLEVEADTYGEAVTRAEGLALTEGGSAPTVVLNGPVVTAMVEV